jgi:hypothetical protein
MSLQPRLLTRIDYRGMRRDELERRLEAARDRMTRADTEQAYLCDAYAEQEIVAALGGPVKGEEESRGKGTD